MRRPFNVLDHDTWPDAFVVRTNESVEFIEPKNGVDFTLEEIYAITGEPTQCVPLNDHPCYQLWCNEEGKLKGLDINKDATLIFNNPFDIIIGDVLVCRDHLVK